MEQQEVTNFFAERKEGWLKKKQKASMDDDEILALHEECENEFALSNWLPKAAKRAGQISMCTHPCTFSHPSARKNKNGYVSSIIVDKHSSNDGYLRSGNVNVNVDALGNAAALDVYKFLTLKMDDGIELIEHIKNNSDIAKSILGVNGTNYDELRSGFLEMISSSNDVVTSSKIKQVYFPIDNENYHLLSILTNSGHVFKLREKIDYLRFSEKIKELRTLKKENKESDESYMEIYDITTIGYGGTKPQNISVQNNKYGGKAHLLYSMPPVVKKRDVRFPKRNFFGESINKWELKDIFFALDKIFKIDYNNVNIREGRIYRYEQIIDIVIQKLYAVRDVAKEQYFEKTSQLKVHQKIWLLDEEKRISEDEWLEKLIKEFTSWFIRSFEDTVGKKMIVYGKEEKTDFINVLEKHKEALR